MSPLTPYSPGLTVFQPGGGAGAREFGKGPLMSTSKSIRAKGGLMVSMVILFTPLSPMIARPTPPLECYVNESGALVLSVCCWGSWESPHAHDRAIIYYIGQPLRYCDRQTCAFQDIKICLCNTMTMINRWN